MTTNTTDARSVSPSIVKVQRFTEDGQQFVKVPLFGVLGAGKYMTLDESVWREGLAAGWSPMFVMIKADKYGNEYVGTCARPISSRGKFKPLARVIMGAERNERVMFRDGDSLNLRRRNLEKMTLAEFNRRRFKHRHGGVAVEYEDAPEPVDVPW